ncbi:uncharacterized protein LOC117065077 [Trachypithecus francoisi]|uniref:uncharacterized protein LOC117065077 n=1 Tax=Trachypithecus francoisi TaxID=54180 RepID=UPI00141ADBB3|nr:uncharacterized protein LOC117065077 [Trachypithecus francoisi]
MEEPRNKLCRDQENSAPRNGGAGTLPVTPAGGVPKDNIRFGATNCVVTEKMSTLGKERFCDREIRCNKCCDRNPPPPTPLGAVGERANKTLCAPTLTPTLGHGPRMEEGRARSHRVTS